MFKLIRIKLVQFYLYEAREVEVGTLTGIFGANGSGKSSLLDAVQTVLLGGNFSKGSGAVYNAQADEGNSNTRTLRSYCLGELDNSPTGRARDEATTYITLTFLDDESQDMVSAGMCVVASASKPDHEILGRYLVPFDITLQDHLEIVDGQERPREWSTFRQQLVRRPLLQSAPDEEVLFAEGGRFLNAMLFRLRGKKSLPRADAFRQAFRFALRMKFDHSVDDIIRRQVLEARPTKTKAFLDMLRGFKELAAKVAAIEHKLGEAKKLDELFQRAVTEERKAVTWKALAAQASLEQANAAVSDAEEAEGQSADKVEEACQSVAAATQRRDLLQQAAARAATQRDQHHAHGESVHLNESITSATRRITEHLGEIRSTLEGLLRALGTPVPGKTVPDCGETLGSTMHSLEGYLERGNFDDADALATIVKLACRAAKALHGEMLKSLMEVGARITSLEQEQKETQENERRIAAGKPPLDTNVSTLQRKLREAGIASTPVCDLLKVADTEWQPVIEAQLGRANVQALLVEKRDEREAFNVYRSSPVYGVKIVRPSTLRDVGPITPGWVAELVTGSDPRAVAFAHKHLRFMRAHSVDDCLRHSFALTTDGMRVADGDLDRIQPVAPTLLKIGPDMSRMREIVQSRLAELKRELGVCEEQVRELKLGMGLLGIFSGDEGENAVALGRVSQSLLLERAALADFQRRLDALDTKEYENLALAAEEALAEAAQANADVADANTLLGAARAAHEQRCADTARHRRDQQDARDAATKARAATGYDPDFAAEQWDKLLEKHGEDFELIRSVAVSGEQSASRNFHEATRKGLLGFGAFIIEFNEQGVQEQAQDWRAASDYITRRVILLNETGLVDKKQEMAQAMEAAKSTFRSNVALDLHEHIVWLDATISRMNTALAAAPAFTNGERYQFKKDPRPAYANLLKFIKDVATHGPMDDLLGGAGEMPPAFDELVVEKAESSRATKSPLDDYREFFDFDVEVLRESPDKPAPVKVGLLSQRVHTGSGGEHRAPLYVIAGAAVASAYQLQGGDDSGMRLILLDEAFMKMDPRNITATMRYFEELRLQVLMASTGEALGTLTAFLTDYYDIMRDSDSNVVVLEGHRISQETRDLFRSDLPEFNPDLVDQELAVMYEAKAAAQLDATQVRQPA
ncbi:AAA family ATPase [Schlegelella sp. S2-27]|uniref:AAA family ATPase n=1 Tax=Caldimonas mangrovi TaxID=2944811 RepID=A0ABT0YN21_9BURK|nr:SbcC/MukB-like Walker B domain-containing protein [Caldimonas mangrovi]MCM5680111.1 AAA family ATPase [Caldimonas mangrovi]